MSKNQRSETPQLRRPRGRPPLPPGERKAARRPATYRPHPEITEGLAKASKASGQSVSREIEERLRRTLEEDRDKGPAELRIDILTGQFKVLVYELLSAFQNPDLAIYDNLQHLVIDQQRLRQKGSWIDTTIQQAGVPARLGPHLDPLDIEINVVRRDDGSITLVQRYTNPDTGATAVLAQTPLNIATAQRLAGELLAACDGREKTTAADDGEKEQPASTDRSQNCGGPDEPA